MATTTPQEEHDFWAILPPTSSRYADWLAVYGPEMQLGTRGLQVPISSPISERVMLSIGVRSCLFVATDILSDEVRERLVQHLAARFNESPSAIVSNMAESPRKSVPILDEDLEVLVRRSHRWFP